MASINLTVSLDNGTSFNGSATLPDNETILDIAATLAGLLHSQAGAATQ